jgi:hypothetical protein
LLNNVAILAVVFLSVKISLKLVLLFSDIVILKNG